MVKSSRLVDIFLHCLMYLIITIIWKWIKKHFEKSGHSQVGCCSGPGVGALYIGLQEMQVSLSPTSDLNVLAAISAGAHRPGHVSAHWVPELLRDSLLQPAPGEGGVLQGEGASAILWGRGEDEQVRGVLCVHHQALRHGEVGLQQGLLLLPGEFILREDGDAPELLRPGRAEDTVGEPRQHAGHHQAAQRLSVLQVWRRSAVMTSVLWRARNNSDKTLKSWIYELTPYHILIDVTFDLI